MMHAGQRPDLVLRAEWQDTGDAERLPPGAGWLTRPRSSLFRWLAGAYFGDRQRTDV